MSSGRTPPGEGRITVPPQLDPHQADASKGPSPKAGATLKQPSLYLNRELTWLNFQHRVLSEAMDRRTPLLERLKFLAIVGSNLDEFQMKRIGGLKQQVGAEVNAITVDGRTPKQQLEECREAVRRLTELAEETRIKVLRALQKKGVRVVPYTSLKTGDQALLRQHYLDNIFPLVTPQAIDPAHPFPFVSNLSINLLVCARDPAENSSVLSRIKLPLGGGIPRHVPVGYTHTFVTLEDVMANNLDLLFPGMEVESCDLFRATRNAITEQDEEQADDLLELIEAELRERKFAPIVRLEVSPGMEPARRERLAQELELQDASDVLVVEGMFAPRDLMELCSLPLPELQAKPHRPIDHPLFADAPNVFQAIRDAGSILVHHPYHSFTSSVERLLKEAAIDPRVRAIKMTLYRTSEDTAVVDQLIEAARNGTHVTVVVELKARFDEAANIRWASSLESAGIHVTYGIVGLKTHAKVILVVRQDPSGLKRYVHVGTGNYHAGTAKLYSDFGLFTCDDAICGDVTELFNYLTTGANPRRRFTKLLLAPHMLKSALIARIEREAEHVRAGGAGLIQMKMNGLEDPDVVRALYAAAQAGVRIELIVRDTCRLRPGVPGLSENIRVISIVGRFLEHTRLYYFRNDGAEEYFIGSADLMTRNLESRVEVVTPIESRELRAELRRVLDLQLNDRRSAWDMQPDGSYVQRVPGRGEPKKSSQEQLISLTQERFEKTIKERKKGHKHEVAAERSRKPDTRPAARPPSIKPPPPPPRDLN
jgi:polyphosphate kinase